MPILRIRNAQGMYTPQQIVSDFKLETNIDLHLSLDGEEISNSKLSIHEFWSQHPVLKKMKSLLLSCNYGDFITFIPDSILYEVKEKLSNSIGFDVTFSKDNEPISDDCWLTDFKSYPSNVNLLPRLYAINNTLIEITGIIKGQKEISLNLFEKHKQLYCNKKEVDFEPRYYIQFFIDESDYYYDQDDENIVFEHSTENSFGLNPKDINCEIEKGLNGTFSSTRYWEQLSLEHNHPVLSPCALFHYISEHEIAPCDLVRLKEYWFDFHHVNQLSDEINYENL